MPTLRNTAAVLVAVTYGTVLAVNRSLVTVRGRSMEPALWAGDRLLTVPARRGWLRPGQVVVVADPSDPEHLVVKRLTDLRADGARVHGDNPLASTDSRSWGPIPRGAIRRVAIARWPDLRTPLRRSGGAHPAGDPDAQELRLDGSRRP